MMDRNGILQELSSCTAVTGFEEALTERMKRLFEVYCDQVEVDAFYNVTGLKKGMGSAMKILIAAHYDEIGFIVKSIDQDGFIRITNMGGVDSKILLAQEVTIHGRKPLLGVIGAKPPHLLKPEENKKAVKLEDLYVDVGMKFGEVKQWVSIGDPVTLETEPEVLNENKFSGKSLDNRASLLAMLEVLEELKQQPQAADVYFVATTQEEFDAAGATVAAYHIRPDIAIVLDACHGEIPDIPKDEAAALGKGPAIGLGPNMHRKLTEKLIALAKEAEIPYQLDLEPDDSGTEAWSIQVSRAGIPTLLISIPVKYMHTAVESVHMEDIRNTGKLVARFLQLSGDEMEAGLCF